MIHPYGRKKFAEICFGFCKSRLFTSTVTLKASSSANLQILLENYSFSPETVSRLASIAPRLRNAEKSDSLLSFLKENGFSSNQLQKIVESRPEYLSSNLERSIKPKIKVFQDLGYSSSVIAELIANDPSILRRGVKSISNSLSFLKGILKSDEKVVDLLRKSGWFLGQTTMENIEFLMSCGVGLDQISKTMYHFPRFFLSDSQLIRKCVAKADKMGVKRTGKMFIHAVRVVRGMSESTWKSKLRTFRDIGFSEDDIVRVFRQAPNVFSISSEKLKKVTDIVVGSGKYDVSCIIKNPVSLCCSVEKRYKPRMKVLKDLESRNLINKWPCFRALYISPDRIFFGKYPVP